jgi:hypothetical protein
MNILYIFYEKTDILKGFKIILVKIKGIKIIGQIF